MELMFGCLGNGVTVWKKGTENTVAHIDDCGAYKLYKLVPFSAVNEIKKHAAEQRDKYRTEYLKQDRLTQYGRFLDSLSMKQFADWIKEEPPHDTVDKIYDLYIKAFVERSGYTMP